MIGFIILGIILLVWVLTWDEPGETVSPAEAREHKHA